MALFIILIVGLILFVLPPPVPSKIATIGIVMFGCALIAICLGFHGDITRALRSS